MDRLEDLRIGRERKGILKHQLTTLQDTDRYPVSPDKTGTDVPNSISRLSSLGQTPLICFIKHRLANLPRLIIRELSGHIKEDLFVLA